MSASMKWRYLDHLQPLSKAKHSLIAMAKKEVCPRDEIADPTGTAVLPIDIHGFAEGLVSFRTLCGVQSSLVRFAPNQAIAWGPPQLGVLIRPCMRVKNCPVYSRNSQKFSWKKKGGEFRPRMPSIKTT